MRVLVQMPPKKKNSRPKSSSGGAAAAAAQEAEAVQQRLAADRDLVLRNEASLRCEIDEEERAAMESCRFQEAESRHLVAAAVSNARYEAREKELMTELQKKAEALQASQEALRQQQQANELLENEKASALRRVALLANELELAQVNVMESERRAASADQGHHDALKKLEGEFDALQQKHHELEAQYAALEAQVPKAAEQTADGEVENAAAGETPAAPPSDAETAALLRVMQTEVERYKATAAQLQEALTHARSEEEKSNLLVGVLNTQLEAVREDNKREHVLSQKRQAEMEAAVQVRREAQEARQAAVTEMDRALSAAAVQQRQLQLELDVHRTEAEKLSKELTLLRDEHAALREELAQVSRKAAEQAQSDIATNAAMQAELANQKKDLQLALKAKEAAEEEKFNHKILTRAELDSLKTRLQRLQETMERKDRESFETIAVLRADAAKQQALTENQSREHDAEVVDLHSRLLSVLSQSEALHNELETLQKSSQQREHDLYEQLTRVTAYHMTASEELERLRATAAQKDAEYTHNFVCLTAECENLKTKLSEATEAVAQHRRTHASIVEQMRAQTEELKGRLTSEAEAQQSARAKESARADLAERNVRRLQDHVRDLEYNTQVGEQSHDEAVKSLQAESRDLRSELSIAKRTIERLENALGDMSSYRQLTELNDRLKKDLEKSQQTVAALNGRVALLQTEAETMGGYTVRKVQEEKEQLTRQLRQAEHRYKLMAPLFVRLRSFVESRLSPALNPELFSALESYDQDMGLIAQRSVPDRSTESELNRAAEKKGEEEEVSARGAAAVAAAAHSTATIPKLVQPQPPSTPAMSLKPRVTLRKPQSTRSSINVACAGAPAEARVRLPAIA